MIIFTGEQRVRTENREAFEAAMRDFCKQVRDLEPGALFYEGARCVTEPGKYIVIEIYKDQAAVDHHGGSEHFKAALVKIAPLIAEAKVSCYERYTA